MGIHIQVAETEEQFARIRAEYDLTPVQLLDRNGVFDVPTLAVGAPHLRPLDVEILREKRPTLVVCPTSEVRRRLSQAPIGRLIESRSAGSHWHRLSDGYGTGGSLGRGTSSRSLLR